MTNTRTCQACGLPLPVTSGRGRPTTMCGECKRGRRRIKEARRGVCVDCQAVFVAANHTGRMPERCDTCRVERKRQTDREKTRRWIQANPDRTREFWNKHNRKRLADPEYRQRKRDDLLQRTYGLTRAELEMMIAAQDGRCAVCSGPPTGPGARLHVDHCHESSVIRGLLCSKCNTAIGLLDDDPERAEALAGYLRRTAFHGRSESSNKEGHA